MLHYDKGSALWRKPFLTDGLPDLGTAHYRLNTVCKMHARYQISFGRPAVGHRICLLGFTLPVTPLGQVLGEREELSSFVPGLQVLVHLFFVACVTGWQTGQRAAPLLLHPPAVSVTPSGLVIKDEDHQVCLVRSRECQHHSLSRAEVFWT